MLNIVYVCVRSFIMKIVLYCNLKVHDSQSSVEKKAFLYSRP